jgi:RimJ/RimL family protein N-acetyltransferase
MNYPIQKYIQSARLNLTAITNEELALYQSLYCDPVTMKFIGPCYDRAQSEVFFQRNLKRTEQTDSGWYFFAIKLTAKPDVIGFITLIEKPSSPAPFELGIMLSSAGRGLGYADEALTALFLHCFTEAKVPVLRARVNPLNQGAIKHIKQFGFVVSPDELQKNAELDSYLLFASAENIKYLQQLSHKFFSQARALAEA